MLSKLLLKPFVAWGDVTVSSPAETGRAPAFGARLSRHDHHCLEIKTWVEPDFAHTQAELDVFVFIPSTFQISGLHKADLSSDFRSRVRLALPSRGDETEGAARAVPDILRKVRNLLSRGNWQSEEDFKQIGGLVSETLKHRASVHRRRFLMAHSLSLPIEQRGLELERLRLEVEQTATLLQTVRQSLSSSLSPNPVLPLLDEYLSNFYVQYLGKLRSAMTDLDPMARERAKGDDHRRAWVLFDTTLSQLQKEEAAYRSRFPQRVEKAEGGAEQELSVVRLSQLKKFFQSRMFVEVSRYSPSHRFLETTAIIGTALAGACWALVQFINSPDLARTTNQGAFVWGFAVLAYVLRDRIKDRAKSSLHRRVAKWLPDSDQQLQAEGRSIGSIREWFHVRSGSQVAPDIRQLRFESARHEIDREVSEEVLHVRKVIAVHPKDGADSGWALQENTRLNIERYLKFMDDPIKELSLLDPSGELTKFRSRRVYHFHVVLDLRVGTDRRVNHVYRVVLDKDGVDRLERISQS